MNTLQKLEKDRIIAKIVARLSNSSLKIFSDKEKEKIFDIYVWWRFTRLMRKSKMDVPKKFQEMQNKYPHLFVHFDLREYDITAMAHLYKIDFFVALKILEMANDDADTQISNGVCNI